MKGQIFFIYYWTLTVRKKHRKCGRLASTAKIQEED